MSRPAVFLDRDGVINYNRPDYVKCFQEFRFLPEALAAFKRLAALDWPVIVVSNQSAIGRGLLSFQTLEDINQRMTAEIRGVGGRIDAVLCCPHHPVAGCACRKPKPGLLLQAARKWNLALEHSYLVGDAHTDVLAAQAVGARPMLVQTGRGVEELEELRRLGAEGFLLTSDIGEAVDCIIASETMSSLIIPWAEASQTHGGVVR